jgi:hypothetical protein
MEGTGDKISSTIRVSVVGPKEVLGVEVIEEDRCPAPDPGDSLQPPPWQAQHPMTVAFRLCCAVAHEDEPRQ